MFSILHETKYIYNDPHGKITFLNGYVIAVSSTGKEEVFFQPAKVFSFNLKNLWTPRTIQLLQDLKAFYQWKPKKEFSKCKQNLNGNWEYTIRLVNIKVQ